MLWGKAQNPSLLGFRVETAIERMVFGRCRYSLRALAGLGKGRLQMIGRGLKLEVEGVEEEELRGMLTQLWRAWRPGMIYDKLKPCALSLSRDEIAPAPDIPQGPLSSSLASQKLAWCACRDDKPSNVLNIHCLEELLLTLKQLELDDTLVVCYYWKFNCYACNSVSPKVRPPLTQQTTLPSEPLVFDLPHSRGAN
jgi:hypothetical protein